MGTPPPTPTPMPARPPTPPPPILPMLPPPPPIPPLTLLLASKLFGLLGPPAAAVTGCGAGRLLWRNGAVGGIWCPVDCKNHGSPPVLDVATVTVGWEKPRWWPTIVVCPPFCVAVAWLFITVVWEPGLFAVAAAVAGDCDDGLLSFLLLLLLLLLLLSVFVNLCCAKDTDDEKFVLEKSFSSSLATSFLSGFSTAVPLDLSFLLRLLLLVLLVIPVSVAWSWRDLVLTSLLFLLLFFMGVWSAFESLTGQPSTTSLEVFRFSLRGFVFFLVSGSASSSEMKWEKRESLLVKQKLGRERVVIKGYKIYKYFEGEWKIMKGLFLEYP